MARVVDRFLMLIQICFTLDTLLEKDLGLGAAVNPVGLVNPVPPKDAVVNKATPFERSLGITLKKRMKFNVLKKH